MTQSVQNVAIQVGDEIELISEKSPIRLDFVQLNLQAASK